MKTFSPLQRILWAYLISNLGTFAARLALAVIIYDLTGSKASLAASFIVTKLPIVLFGNALGRIASVLNQKKLMLMADACSALLFIGLAIFYRTLGPIWTALAFFLSYVLLSLFDAAKSHYVTHLTKTSDELNYTVATLSELLYIAIALGPFMAGHLTDRFGVTSVLLFNSLSFLISITFIWSLPDAPVRATAISAIRKGLHWRGAWSIVNNLRIIRAHAQLLVV